MKGTLVLCPYWWFWKIFCSNLGDEPQKQNVLFSFDPEQQASCQGSVLVRQTCEGARRPEASPQVPSGLCRLHVGPQASLGGAV